jgi:hypothetical protein
MKVANLNSTLWLNYWWCGVSRALKKLFFSLFCFGFVLLFCRLLQRDLGELVSMLERDPGCSMELFMRCVNHDFVKGLVRRF